MSYGIGPNLEASLSIGLGPYLVFQDKTDGVGMTPGAEARDPQGLFLRKEVIQPQVPLRLPCYDFTPVADLTVVGCLLAVSAPS